MIRPLPMPHQAQRVRRALSHLRAGSVTLGATVVLLALLAGVPYGLVRWVGWPLPHHWPNSAELTAALSGPVTDRLLVDALACMCWVVWIVFVTDIMRVLPDAAREARLTRLSSWFARTATGERPSGPLRGFASLLLVTIFCGILSLRPHAIAGPRSRPELAAHRDPVLVATTKRASANSADDSQKLLALDHTIGRNTAVVLPPRDGVYDSLWRIADRCLGSGERWPEIFRLNRGLPQPDGGSLQLPSLVEPGWVLRLPASPSGPSPRRVSSTPAAPSPSTPAPPTKPSASVTPGRPRSEPATSPGPRSAGPTSASSAAASAASHSLPNKPPTRATHPRDGVDVGDGLYVSLSMAAAVSAALLVVRRRRRRWYRPDSGRRNDLPVAPVVRSLHLAHLRTITEDRAGCDDEDGDAADCDGNSSGPDLTAAAGPTLSREQLLASSAGGLGLVGDGAQAAVLAALLEFLASDPPAKVLVPRADLARLLDGQLPEPAPKQLCVVDGLATALDELDEATLHRAAHAADNYPPTVLIANPVGNLRRLQAVLDNGARYGLRAVLLGQWRSGTSIYLAANGVITAANERGRDLVGTRAYAVPAPSGLAVLAVLAEAESPSDRDTLASRDETTDHVGNASVGDRQQLEPVAVAPDATTSRSNSAVSGSGASGPSEVVEHDRTPHGTPALAAARTVRRAAASTGRQHTPELRLQLFGPPRLHRAVASNGGGHAVVDLLAHLTPRQRDLLILVALHPTGLARERIADALWPDSTGRPLNTLHNTLNRLRRRLSDVGQLTAEQASQIVTVEAGRCRLEPRLVSTDYREFAEAATARRTAGTDTDRDQACQRIVDTYRGELAEQHSADWLEIPRETARRDAVDAATRLARTHVGANPRRALELLETARGFDPYNEPLYLDIMRIQRRLGRADAINRTLALLSARLAELNETPSADTLALATSLQQEVAQSAPRPPSGATAPGQRP